LLTILAGILYPDVGEVTINGKVSTLFALGTGFHPELSGRENIYLNGSILGLSKKEIDQKFDQILEFSELKKFIDTPIKHYSSGMQVRLAFSVAINVNPEILLVDEVLAVGDAAFQNKSFSVFNKFKKSNATIVFVSHDLGKIQDFCDRALYLKNGKVEFIGSAGEVTNRYLYQTMEQEQQKKGEKTSIRTHRGKTCEIGEIKLLGKDLKEKKFFETGDELLVRVFFKAAQEIKNPVFGVAIYKEDGTYVTGPNTKSSKFRVDRAIGDGYFDYRIKKLPLLHGNYYVSATVCDNSITTTYDLVEKGPEFTVPNLDPNEFGIMRFDDEWGVDNG